MDAAYYDKVRDAINLTRKCLQLGITLEVKLVSDRSFVFILDVPGGPKNFWYLESALAFVEGYLVGRTDV